MFGVASLLSHATSSPCPVRLLTGIDPVGPEYGAEEPLYTAQVLKAIAERA